TFVAIEHDLEIRGDVLAVHRMGARQLVERIQEAFGEERMNAKVDLIQVARERYARRVERRLIARFDAGDVVFDRSAPALDADGLPAPRVLALSAFTVGAELAHQRIAADRGDRDFG